MKDIDDELDSDGHDQTEQFEASKMKEFNNLLTDVAKRDQQKISKKLKQSSEIKSQKMSQKGMG